MKRKDLTGKIFGRLKVVKIFKILNDIVYWNCECICKRMTVVTYGNLTSGHTKSCGCLSRNQLSKHGDTNTKFHNIWYGILRRCADIKGTHYEIYGGRGIKVCARWNLYINFKEDMYESYLEHVEKFGEDNTSIDRIDSNGNYEPSNCRWLTWKEQSRNRRASPKTDDYKEYIMWKSRLRTNLVSILKKRTKVSKFLEHYLDCSTDFFRQYIESLFHDGMTWDNYGKGKGKWQIDHIIGCNNFDLSREEDRLKCFNYKNLQPLWYDDHIKKSILRIKQ